MKTLSTSCIAAFIICFISFKSIATTVIVNVQDFEFTPSTFTVNTNDTIMWMWDNSAGAHTTTSTVIPSGAVEWDHVINQSSQTFMYIPAVGGSYDYHCSIHFAMGMTGHFTVINLAGIEEFSSASVSLKIMKPIAEELQIIYNIPKTSTLSIRMYNLIGNEVNVFVSSSQKAGTYSHAFSTANLSRGIYIIRFETADALLWKKIIIQ